MGLKIEVFKVKVNKTIREQKLITEHGFLKFKITMPHWLLKYVYPSIRGEYGKIISHT